jgi:hypothetical protein
VACVGAFCKESQMTLVEKFDAGDL